MAEPSHADAPRRFATTRWSVVLAAGRDSSPESTQALAELCRAYWFPLYVFVRRLGRSADEAQDLTQEFFARLLEKGALSGADPGRGHFPGERSCQRPIAARAAGPSCEPTPRGLPRLPGQPGPPNPGYISPHVILHVGNPFLKARTCALVTFVLTRLRSNNYLQSSKWARPASPTCVPVRNSSRRLLQSLK